MTMGAIEQALPTRERVRELAETRGVCLSIYLPPHRPAGPTATARAAMRGAMQAAGERLRAQSVRGPDIEELLRPLVDLAAQEDFERGHTESWAIFRCEGKLEFFQAPMEWPELTATEDRFLVLPLLAWLGRHHACFLLAVTHKGVRLYRLENGHLAAEALPQAVPPLFDEERMRNASEHGANRSSGTHFGVISTSDRAHRMYRDYFAEVGRGLQPLLERAGLPLVLAGSKETASAYRDAAGNHHLLSEALTLSPDGGFTERDLETRLLPLLALVPMAEERRAAERIGSLGVRKTKTDLPGVLRAAAEGRVGGLFLLQPAHDPASMVLLNQAAADTLSHGGEVWVVPKERMPVQGALIAEIRY